MRPIPHSFIVMGGISAKHRQLKSVFHASVVLEFSIAHKPLGTSETAARRG
jgi:hypothetical protein